MPDTPKEAGGLLPGSLSSSAEARRVLIYFAFILAGCLLSLTGGFAGITPFGVRLLFLFFAVIYGWSVTMDPWPSWAALVLMPLLDGVFHGVTVVETAPGGVVDIITYGNLLLGGWGSDTGLFMVMIFIIIAFFELTGLPKFIASWTLSRKILQGRPLLFLFALYFTSYILCAMINIFVGVLMLYRIIQSISTALGYERGDKFPTIAMFGVGMTGALGLSAFPWSFNSLVLIGFFNNMLGYQMDMLKFISFSVPYATLAIVLYLLVAKFVLRLDTDRLKNLDPDFIKAEDRKAALPTKIALWTLLAVVAILLLPSFLPKTAVLYMILNGMGNAGRLIVVFTVLVLLNIGGVKLFNFQELAMKINWGAAAVCFIVIPLGSFLVNPATGISQALATTIMPLLNGLPPFAFIAAITFFVVVITNCLANMPVCMMFAPIGLQAAAMYGFANEQIAFLLIVSCTIAWMLPSASPAGIVLYAFSDGYLKVRDILKMGLIGIVICFAALMIVFFTIGNALF
ncbi:MAG: hypothetical protein LBS10_02595 [Gracilibacteraceae bacterium]|jgi:sodium-dependent dicarboxylate transporter 2/3/5|nr:hypothetical protein [Gracilibacteraceae bacterium]